MDQGVGYYEDFLLFCRTPRDRLETRWEAGYYIEQGSEEGV